MRHVSLFSKLRRKFRQMTAAQVPLSLSSGASSSSLLQRVLGCRGVPKLMSCINRKSCPTSPTLKIYFYRIHILLVTFVAYTLYHMLRKSLSVVKTKLLSCPSQNSSSPFIGDEFIFDDTVNCTSFISELNGTHPSEAHRWLGSLDATYLFAYAFGMFISGFVAERVDLRYFLSTGMILSGISSVLFGMAYYLNIRSLYYLVFIQLISGLIQTTGWPGVVTLVANWFGKRSKKGRIFGLWNTHTSLGNILGSLLAGAFVEQAWGMSFIMPGLCMISFAFVVFLTVVPKPQLVDLHVNDNRGGGGANNDESEGESQTLLRHTDSVDIIHPTSSAYGSTDPTSDGDETPRKRHHDESSPNEDRQMITPPHSTSSNPHSTPINFMDALRIPGVIEFSLSLFFAKLVGYTFLFWLPTFIQEEGHDISSADAAYMSIMFDVGGAIGGILAGFLADYTGKNASTCVIMLILSIPTLFIYEEYGHTCPLDMSDPASSQCFYGTVSMLLVSGLLVNGPYSLITTAVSAELGSHPSVSGRSSSKDALATVTAIVDGTGSIGAALGPLMASNIANPDTVFIILMVSDVFATILLFKLFVKEQADNFRRVETWIRYIFGFERVDRDYVQSSSNVSDV